MKTVALVCVLALSAARASPAGIAADRELVSLNAVDSLPRAAPASPSFGGLEQLSAILQGLWAIGSELARTFGGEGATDAVARALQETDPVEVALNTIDLDTMPCRQRLACELRSGITGYTFGGMAYELLASRLPSLKKYGRVSARELGVSSCGQAFACRFSDSPLMDTARQMRSLAGDFCDMDGDSFTGRLCRAFTYVMDSLEAL